MQTTRERSTRLLLSMGNNAREPSTGAINGLAPVNNQTMRPRAWSAGDAKYPPAPKPPSLVPPSAGAIATDLRADTHIPNKRNNRQCVLVLKASIGEGYGPLTSLLWAFIQSCLGFFGGPQPGQQLNTKRPLVSNPSVFGFGGFPRKYSYAAALAAQRHSLVGFDPVLCTHGANRHRTLRLAGMPCVLCCVSAK